VKKGFLALMAGMALIAAGSAADAKDWSKMRIGTEGAYLPWNGLDASGKLVGFELDLGRDLCRRINAECEFIAQDWDGMIPALQSGKYDVIMAGMSVTPERRQVIDFAGPYAMDPVVFATLKGSKLLQQNLPDDKIDMAEISPDEQKQIDAVTKALKGKTVGVQVSTIHQNMLEQMPGIDMQTYDKVDNIGLDLVSGRIDAMLADRSAIEALIKAESGGANDITIFGPAFTRGVLGIGVGAGVRKADTDLREKLDKAIQEAAADGTITRLSTQWFGFDTSIR
jgi:octopine/nopaline transport system substrate-binding protein